MEDMQSSEKEVRSGNKFVAFIKKIFVHNIGWKLLALATSAVIWFLVAGLW